MIAVYHFEQQGVPQEAAAGAQLHAMSGTTTAQPGGNMEGKEVRFGIADSSIYAAATTAASNGSVNAMHDSFTPLGGLVPLVLLDLGEVIFGGVGSGLYGMLIIAIVAIFIAGLMVGRTPEYLGKKIEMYEMKMASLILLIPIMAILVARPSPWPPERTCRRCQPRRARFLRDPLRPQLDSGQQRSAFAGLSANTTFYNIALGIAMLIGGFGRLCPPWPSPVLWARRRTTRERRDPADGRAHVVGLLIAVVVVVAALSFIPALALGPIIEHLLMIH